MQFSANVTLTDADIRTALSLYIKEKHPTVDIDREKIILRVHQGQRGPDTYSATISIKLPE